MAGNWLTRLGVNNLPSGYDCVTDCELLGRFLSEGDVSALEAIVRRHGPLVLSVCRRMLRREQDVEDAFQATFLALVRKAPSLGGVEAIGNWLYGVSYRVSLQLRAAAVRAAELERRYSRHSVTASPAPQSEGGAELAAIIDDAVHGLPRKYREPVVLCLMQDLSRTEAARRLGLKEGTLSGRLARAKEMLAERLRRRGVVLSAAALTICLSVGTANAVVPTKLIAAAVRAAGMAVSSHTAAPTNAVVRPEPVGGMVRTKVAVWFVAGGSLLALTLGLVAASWLFAPDRNVPVVRSPDQGPPSPPVQAGGAPPITEPTLRSSHRKLIEGSRWVLFEVDITRGTLSVADSPNRPGPGFSLTKPDDAVAPAGIRLDSLPLAAGVTVVLDGLPAKLDDLRPGMFAELTLGDTGHAVVKVTATRPRPTVFSCVLERIEGDRRQIWVRVVETNLLVDALEVAADATIIKIEVAADAAPRLTNVRLQDLVVGTSLSLHVTARPDGRLVVTQIQAGSAKALRK